MANEEHLEILKRGVEAWNRWRIENPEVWPDLTEANLTGAFLERANLSRAILTRADFTGAILFRANLLTVNFGEARLSEADLSGALLNQADLGGKNLHGVNLREAYLEGASLVKADLSDANLIQANLRGADLGEANLRGSNLAAADLSRAILVRVNLSDAILVGSVLAEANLYGADVSGAFLWGALLYGANLSRVNLRNTDLTEAILEGSTFSDVSLDTVKGLESVKHLGPSSIGIDTIHRSTGNIPEIFLQGTGVPASIMTYIGSLTEQAIQFYSCFISYSHKDEAFVRRLHADLQQEGVRCWFAPEDMRIGSKIRPTIDQAIRLRDKLLLILSKQSINSGWVETEVETAFAEERIREQTVLFPIRLDEAVMRTYQPWAANIRDTRHIGDFSRWKDHDAYQQAFERLLRDLRAEE